MSQATDYTIDNQSFPSFRSDLNEVFPTKSPPSLDPPQPPLHI